VIESMQHSFPNLAGESRLSDGTNQFFHVGAVATGPSVRPAPPTDGGFTPPPHRPDVPCETQEIPNLNAPGGPIAAFQSEVTSQSEAMEAPAQPMSREAFREGVLKAKQVFLDAQKLIELDELQQQKEARR
jgi:hypothetical protein